MYANPNLINKTQPRKTFLCSRKVKILIRNMLKICLCFHFPLFARIPNTTPQLGGKTKPANLKLRAAGKQKPRSWYKVNMRRANKHIQHSAIPATCKHVELLRVMGLLHFSGVPPHFYTTLFYSILYSLPSNVLLSFISCWRLLSVFTLSYPISSQVTFDCIGQKLEGTSSYYGYC